MNECLDVVVRDDSVMTVMLRRARPPVTLRPRCKQMLRRVIEISKLTSVTHTLDTSKQTQSTDSVVFKDFGLEDKDKDL